MADEDPPPPEPAAAAYPLRERHRWSFKNHFLSGVTLPAWLRLLRRYGASIDWAHYWHRAAFLTLMACVNSLMGLLDSLLYGRRIAAQRLHPHPIIVLGHPRTGTTLLHNLLSLDPRFACARTLHAGFPAAFLWVERFSWALAGLVDDTRPMDAMPLSLDTPAEDEIAMSAVAGVSAYLPLCWMRDWRRFAPLYDFRGAPEEDLAAWRDAALWFYKKVTLRWARRGEPRPLVIKSPVHTARVALLLRLFPGARFVFVHRDPLTTFASAGHMANTYYWYTAMQRQTEGDVTEFILDQGERLHAAYLRDRGLIPKGQLVEVSFAELDADPVAALQRVYTGLGLGDFEAARPAVQAHVAGLQLAGFKKNAHRPLSPALRQRVRQRWRETWFEPFGYSLHEEEDGGQSGRGGA